VLVSYETVSRMKTSLISAQEVNKRTGKQAHAEAVRHWSEKYVPELRKLLKDVTAG
jgi:hypothetical protein